MVARATAFCAEIYVIIRAPGRSKTMQHRGKQHNSASKKSILIKLGFLVLAVEAFQ